MHEPWFYCPQLATGAVELDPAESRHALMSLRLRPGAVITLFDGAGRHARAVLLGTADSGRGKRAVAAARVEQIVAAPLPSRPLTLISAGCKGERQDWLIEKCTELGVARFVFAEFEHSVVHLSAKHEERCAQAALAACKQARRAYLPGFRCGVPLSEALQAVAGSRLLTADLTNDARRWSDALPPTWSGHVAVVIGPEGGLGDAERATLAAAGGVTVSLGPYVLRVETAAVAAAAIIAAGAVD